MGRKVYNERCYFCHGYSGDAKTVASTYLTPPPRDFTAPQAQTLSLKQMLNSVRHGKPGTAMQAFAGILSEEEINAVVSFVRQRFIIEKGVNTRYHTAENGWPDHEQRYAPAYPYARGELAIDAPEASLTPAQLEGRRLFLNVCLTCHEGRQRQPRYKFEVKPRSYPRGAYSHQSENSDAMSGATPYAKHDQAPQLQPLTPQERSGERLFQQNCAFCHAADGTGKNWIGSFLQPHPRDLTNPEFMRTLSRARLLKVMREGLPGTTMPAWQSVLNEDEMQAIAAYIERAFHPLAAASPSHD